MLPAAVSKEDKNEDKSNKTDDDTEMKKGEELKEELKITSNIDRFESNKTFNPTLYAWEVTKACSNPDYNDQMECEENNGDWSGLYGIPTETDQEIAVEGLSDSEINYHKDFLKKLSGKRNCKF